MLQLFKKGVYFVIDSNKGGLGGSVPLPHNSQLEEFYQNPNIIKALISVRVFFYKIVMINLVICALVST